MIQDRNQVLIKDVFLTIRKLLETGSYPVQLLRIQCVPQLLESRLQSMAPRVFTEDESTLGHTYHLRCHYLIGTGILEDAVLVNASLVSKRVPPDNRFVGLRMDAC